MILRNAREVGFLASLLFICIYILMTNCYIYIKTPEVGYVNTDAHIVEHCAVNRENISLQDFFGVCDIKGECYVWYTRYDVYEKIDIEKFIQGICTPLDKRVFKKEISAFKEETKHESFTGIFKKKVEKLLHNPLDILHKKTSSREQINAYHTKYYTRKNMVICTWAYKILENNIPTKTPWKWSLSIKKQYASSLRGEINKITILPYTHRKSQVLLYFIEFLYDTSMEYQKRYLQWTYDVPTSCMIEMSGYVAIAIPQHLPYDISLDFLNEAKKHFCDISLNEYARKIEIINLVYIWQLPTDEEIKEFIQSIAIETIKKIT